MDSKQFHRRVWAVVVLLAIILTSLGSTLFDLQINHGDDYYSQSQYKILETETVDAGRGQILDRNGRVLVSDTAVYQVTLDTSLMGSSLSRNEILLSLVQAARDSGVDWADTLPISTQKPFVFTTTDPYYTVTEDEDGGQTKTLTRLGQLAVKLGWLKEDPTKDPEPVAEAPVQPQESGFFDKIKHFFTGSSSQSSSQEETQEPEVYTLPTAEELLGIMCSYFGLGGEGVIDEKTAPEGTIIPTLNIGDLDPADARAVAGVLYELNLRSQEIYQISYVFAEDVDINFISRVKELSLAGVNIEATTVRQYHTTYAAHILGRVAAMSPTEWSYYKTVDLDEDGVADYSMNDKVGKEGVELAFESYLRGTSGTRSLERNTNGKVVSETWLTEPEPGDNVMLTLDLDLQIAVEDILASAIPKLASDEVEGAACVVLDVNTGEVLAMASYPTFNLATYGADFTENSENPLNPLLNRATRGLYAPGSTFKMITAIAGLEEGIITPSTQIYDTGRYVWYPGYSPKCWIYSSTGHGHGWQNVSQAITNSCNYFFYDVGRQLGIDRLVDYATRFGLGQKTGLELTEAAGVMASREYTESLGSEWYDGSTLSVAIGQESTQVTPIQLASYIATLVNGGTHYSTHLLKAVKSSDFSQLLYTYEPEILSTIDIQPENLQSVLKGMLDLTTDGSVKKYFADLGFQVGAKTGSAQISAQTESNAVFVCFAPYEAPEIAVSIVVEHGGSGSELGAMAADILASYFSAKETREDLLTENTLIR